MTRICFAILAHDNEPCVVDLIGSLRRSCQSPALVLFNGGRNPRFAAAIDVEVCPYSRPLRHGKLPDFHFGIMRWLHEECWEYDFLITLDADMLLIKPGLESYLEAHMADSAYMAINFSETYPDTDWRPGRRHHYHWRQVWQPIFGTENPYHCFNPGQIFRRDYVERFMTFSKRHDLLTRTERSMLPVLEEMIFPTLAMTLECNPRMHPGSQVPPARDIQSQESAIRWEKRHSPREICRHVDDPHAFLIHPVPMTRDAPERTFVLAIQRGGAVDVGEYQHAFESSLVQGPPPRAATVAERTRTLATAVYGKLREEYMRVVPQ